MSDPKISNPDRAAIVAIKFFKQNNIICFNDTFYYYKNGIFRMEDLRNTHAWISKEYASQWATATTTAQIKEVGRMIQDLTYNEYRKAIKLMNDQRGNFINVLSGILNLETLEIKSYEKSDFCFHKLPFDYIDDASCPDFAKFLTTSMNFEWGGATDSEDYKQVMQFIQEWMGYTLIPGNPFHKGMILYGSGRNGKGVLTDIWSYILGEHNVSFVDIKGINDGKTVFLTRNKLANFSYDIESGQQLDTGIIKSAVAGEKVMVDEKYKAQYDMNFTAKLIISCNDLPYIRNAGAAIRERFYVLPFLRTFNENERDPNLKQKLRKEAAHIFSWAVNGLKRLMDRGYFIAPERCHLSANDYLKSNDTIAMWVDEDNIRQEGQRAKKSEAWKYYKEYCQNGNFYTISKSKFYSKVIEAGFEEIKSNGERYFKNMYLPNQTLV